MIIPIVTTLIGAIFRFTALNWDMGGRLHPDEALIVNGALSIRFFTQLSPGFHDYNGFPVYLLKIASLVAPMDITLVGKFLSALLSTVSIPLMYLLGTRLWNKNVGVLAGLLFACAPLLIQLAHFYTTESILIFLLLILLNAAISYSKKKDIRSLVFMAIPMGLLLATKNTSYLFLPIPLGIIAAQKHIRDVPVLILLVLVTFFLASPYSFLDLSGYLIRSKYLSDVVNGNLLMDWTLQFQETTPLFWIPNLIIAFGPILIGIIGMLLSFRKKISVLSLFAFWAIGYLLFILFTYLKFIRYSAPLAPFLALFTAKLLWDIRKTITGKVIAYSLITIQALWAIMFFHIYLILNPSITAAYWIASHIPPHSVILTEEWNSIIRFDRPPFTNQQYGFRSFNGYAIDMANKQLYLTTQLENSDYIVIESPKVRHTISKLHNRYPWTNAFYTNLEHGKSKFTKVAEFSSYPHLGPLVLNDEFAEETWYAFDHPTVRIYKKSTTN